MPRFGVPFFARELMKVVSRYGIKAHFQQNLVAVDGAAKTATFETVGGDDKGKRTTVTFDMLHVSPPQSPHDAIKKSPLADAAGWVEVNQNSMQHIRYPNVFSLGDVCSTPNAKTAAAVRKQSPIVVRVWQDHPGRIHLWQQSHADVASRSGEGTLDRLVDQDHRIADLLLELHAQGL
jgi:sulfide:quinone oxidoreductase